MTAGAGPAVCADLARGGSRRPRASTNIKRISTAPAFQKTGFPVLQRIQKLLAAEGIGSRREIEDLIRRGEVRVNGRVAQLGDRAAVADEIRIGSRRVTVRGVSTSRVIAYNKPCGEIVSRSDRFHRTVFARFPRLEHGRWIAVGRLDVNTSGLLLACNDGELAHRLMHPSYRIPRTYRVRVRGEVDDDVLRRLLKGVVLGERTARFESVRKEGDAGGANRWFEVMLREGRNREVRRLWASQGLEVSRLVRTAFAGIVLDTRPGAVRELSREESAGLYRAVGLEPPA